MKVKITITHAKYTPKWETLQAMLREAIDANGVITRISRPDRRSNYRAPGKYAVDFRLKDGTVTPVDLEVKS